MTIEEIMKRPICPIASSLKKGTEDYPWVVHCDPECAWYNEDRQQCAILTLATSVRKMEVNRK